MKKLNILKYYIRKKPYPLEKPLVLQFPVNDICNSKCQMCKIWENKKSDDITSDQLRIGIKNPLFNKVQGVGINGGEPTLRKDLGELVSVLYEELPSLKKISLITNAFNVKEVIARIKDVGEVIQGNGGYFDLMISLDGYGEVHDLVRGKPGNFDRAKQVIGFAKTSPLIDNIRIGCTIIKENVYDLSRLFDFCQEEGLYIKYRLGIPHQRLYTENLSDPYMLSFPEKYHIAEFLEGLITHYEKNAQQKFFYRSLIDQLIHGAPRKAGCDWQHRGATITSKGELLFCAVKSKTLGIITSDDSNKIYFEGASHLQSIIENECDNCYHDYTGLLPRGEFLKQVLKRYTGKLNHNNFLIQNLKQFNNKLNFTIRKKQFKRIIDNKPPRKDEISKRVKVLICGWYGTETLGDKAILGGIIISLKKINPEFDITLVSLNPYVSEMTKRQMEEMVGVKIMGIEDGLQFATTVNLVVFGGGPLMALDQLAEMEYLFKAAIHNGAKAIIAGCGVGPLGDKWHNQSIFNILKMADVRIFRDMKSLQNAKMLGIDTKHDHVAEDPAFTWLFHARNYIKDTKVNQPILLLGLRDFPFKDYARHLETKVGFLAKEKFESEVIKTLETLVDLHPNLRIRPLPMCTNHFGDDDRWFYQRLFRGNKKLQNKLDYTLLNQELSPWEYCVAFKEARCALTMRFHALVFALGLEVPAVAIDYTLGKGKVKSLAEKHNIPHQSLDHIDTKFLLNSINEIWAAPKAQAQNLTLIFPEILKKSLDFSSIYTK